MAAFTLATVVSIPYSDLQDQRMDISKELELGFGPNGLGIVAVSGVPRYNELRHKLLLLAERLAALPDDTKKTLEDPISRYSFGWSHGKEILESGHPDVLKGSFYANPLVDKPTSDEGLIQRYPSYCRPNLWPTKDIPELEQVFKELGRLIIDVGLLLVHHCDKYVASKSAHVENVSLEEILRKSSCPKGRLLHYFPPPCSKSSEESFEWESWCGWHLDHGSLTGLTCAMYTKDGMKVTCPDRNAGLYVKMRSGAIVKANFQEDHIAYQMGETTEFLTEGLLHATPHCVRTASGADAFGIARNTFAVFMQPQWDYPLRIKCAQSDGKGKGEGFKYVDVGEFAEETLSKYYKSELDTASQTGYK